MTDVQTIFQDYLAAQSDETPADFAPLLKQFPQHAEALRKKIAAYTKIVALMRDDDRPNAEAPSLVGREIGGCTLMRVLGQGGMGVAYLGRQEKLNRSVVVKVLRPFAADNKALKERFIRESRTIGRLNHKNIVPVYDVGEQDGSFYIVMRYIEGVPLNEFIEKFSKSDRSLARIHELLGVEAKTSTAFLCTLIIQVADAVQYAHDNGVIHRDIKPSNIIIEPDGNPILLDFGLSHDDVETTLTLTGDFLGTPIYSAPERFQKNASASGVQLDVYALGVTFYELITGGLPYTGNSIYEIYSNIKRKDPISPSHYWQKIPRDLETIVMKCLEREPEGRYPSIGALRGDIQSFLDYAPISATPTSFPAKWLKKIRRNPLPAALSIMVLVSVVLLTQLIISRAEMKSRENINTMRRMIGIIQTDIRNNVLTPEVIDILEKALAISNTHPEAVRAASDAYCRMEKHEQCLKYNTLVLKETPFDREAMMNIGNSYFAQGRLDLALNHALEWSQHDEKNPEPFAMAAKAYVLLQSNDEARRYIDIALTVDPMNEFAIRMKGLICSFAGDDKCAEEYMLRGVELYPESAAASKALAGYYAMKKSPQTTLAEIERGLTLNRFDSDLRNMHVDFLNRVGRRSEALSESVTLTTLYPSAPEHWMKRSGIEEELGLIGASVTSYETSMALAPDRVSASDQMRACFMYINLNRLEDAKGCITDALAKFPDDGVFKVLLAYHDYLMKDYDTAMQRLIELSDWVNDNPFSLSLLSQLYFEKSDYDRAVSYAKMALALDRNAEAAKIVLIKSYKKKGLNHQARMAELELLRQGGKPYVVSELNLSFAPPVGWEKEEERSIFEKPGSLAEFKPQGSDGSEAELTLSYIKSDRIDLKEKFSRDIVLDYFNTAYDPTYLKVDDVEISISQEGETESLDFKLYAKQNGKNGIGLGRWVVANGLIHQVFAFLNNSVYQKYEKSVVDALKTLEVKE